MKKVIKLDTYTIDEVKRFIGNKDENIQLLEEAFHTQIIVRGDELVLDDEEQTLDKMEAVFTTLLKLVKQGKTISKRDIMYTLKLAETNHLKVIDELYQIKIARTMSGKLIYPKTLGQKEYYYALKHNDVVFGIGPAGTGKTYLAVVFAVQALKNNEVKKIILTRPAVEAGENLGFLPGDLKEKVDPYLRPLYDALYDMLGQEQTERLIEKGTIEIAPLAYMRGRTLEDAYVILDEAQNTTDAQMKMFLTRLGFNSKMIVTGDVTQIDLPKGIMSGLKRALHILKDVQGIRFVYLSAMDVVRHPVVQKIIERYESDESYKESREY
ncbi:MAG: PhoH family protein [Coprobacillus cateniformis]|uniref:PhoH-like protein n=1 Tax=Longibaculum muris TaxID=1796628 RepID=A0A4R3YEI5_9FIRM|nr:PhoH family protein [Longibaculum muris]KXU52122.1 PhoH family protein [Candidatus Stoquefichus sp. KLE1796]MBS5113108.1 PhoH family protein [Coprobacillus cateniformis]MCR1889471.1 PhoH family protein [Longibaculum muris]MED9812226.1 PhoH family protein [Longibaculum muris]TCV90945.1 phosphate starvation-inducible PhoH-like protein [Longibaculum muris]